MDQIQAWLGWDKSYPVGSPKPRTGQRKSRLRPGTGWFSREQLPSGHAIRASPKRLSANGLFGGAGDVQIDVSENTWIMAMVPELVGSGMLSRNAH